ncbi:hypothetical protein PtrSN001A_007242 [Pyrenophora tritici-repentis]|nr:hypothetical protein PtrSN001A_007242 [Pyrenophora tritici-repentis]
MTSSPEHVDQYTAPVSNLTYLHKQQSKSHKVHDTPQPRGRNTTRYELGRRNRGGEKVTRIYPNITKSPSAKRLSSTSPPTNYNATTSPLLSAIGASRTPAAQYTNEWAKSVPFFPNSGSPGNGGIAIAGSPPTFQNSPSAREGLYAHQAMSNSPPTARPLSHPNQYTTFGGRMQNSPGRDRRASIYSQGGRPTSQQFAANPPLPHQAQPHYYGLPNLDFLNTAPNKGGMQPGEGGHFCGFDTLSMAGDEAARTSENVLVVGSQGGLDVFRVEKSKMDLVGRLEGLRGAVIGAKILPWTSRMDPSAPSRPLVALVLHGPVVKDSRSSSGSGASSAADDSASDSPSRPSSRHGNANGQISGYQTTVEVYSLKERRRIAVLYRTPMTPLTNPIDSPLFQPPPPVGDFVVDAKGKFVIVASGTSGEVFIFAPYLQGHLDYAESFHCIGKIWTSVQNRERVIQSGGSSAADGSQDEIPPEKYGLPVFSLSDRWLAVTPPASSALYPVNGVALTSPYYERAPGLAHHSVPPQPSPNCAVDAPNEAGLIDRLTREGTQVAIKSARWATEKGMQAFKSYMNKGQQGQQTYTQDPMQHYFPPTHGHDQTQPRQESTVISVYDLQKLLDAEETRSKNSLQPIATIPAALGCSFLSFAPSGLMLMSVSKKGDYQDIWDLKRMTFRRARKTAREQPTGPHVRQVARFTRMTVANVIDVVWSAPRADKLAVITDKGTVHMFPMPASAFQWPPPRRIRPSAPPPPPKENIAPAGATGAVSSAMQAISSAKPWFDAVRTRGNNRGPRFSLSSLGVTPAAGAKSGKAVAAGVGKSISNIRHAGDNKMTLPPSPSGIKPYSVRWMSGRGRGSIALVSGGVLQIWRIQMRPPTGKGKSSNTASITKKKLVEFVLAPRSDAGLPPSVAEQLYPQPGDPEQTLDCYGDWFPRSLSSRKPIGPTLAPLSFSEIETNPPYQPFYTDKRVTRFIYSRHMPEAHSTSASEYLPPPTIPELVSSLHHEDTSPWLFGEIIEATRISSPTTQAYDSGGEEDFGGVAARIENKLVLRDGEEEVEQVVVTTRRRRVKHDGEEEGFFEDDCEVLDFAEDRV